MPGIARGQVNTPWIINWFISVNNILTDAFEVGFQIWDITGGLPGTQVFPAVADTWETVSDSDGHFSVGSYYAFDVAHLQGWGPSLTEPIGTHRVKWRWKITAAAPYQMGQEDLEVLVQSGGTSADTYCSVQDIRDEGITLSQASDLKVLSYIETWQTFLDRACRQWFIPKSLILSIDGNDSDTLFFGVPIISLDYLKLNSDTAELDPSYYRAYLASAHPNNRHNPKISLIGPECEYGIYSVPSATGTLKFRKGRQNQEVKGTFGYVDDGNLTPKLIRRALTLLVVEKLTTPINSSSGTLPAPPILGSILEEETDGPRIRYGETGIKDRKMGLSGITSSQEVMDIIRLYRAPLGVATPANWSY